MAVKPTDFSKHDQEIWDEELQDFIPDRVFDAHVHLFNPVHLPEAIREKHAWGYTDWPRCSSGPSDFIPAARLTSCR